MRPVIRILRGTAMRGLARKRWAVILHGPQRAPVGHGFTAGQKLVGRLLHRLGFSLQANSKTREGASHPDRNASSSISTPTWRRSRLPASQHLGRHQEERCAAEARKEFTMN